jgi:hypothetical protein
MDDAMIHEYEAVAGMEKARSNSGHRSGRLLT